MQTPLPLLFLCLAYTGHSFEAFHANSGHGGNDTCIGGVCPGGDGDAIQAWMQSEEERVDGQLEMLQVKAGAKWLPNCPQGKCGDWNGANEPVYTRDSPCIGGWKDGDGRGSFEKPAVPWGRKAEAALTTDRQELCKQREEKDQTLYFYNGVSFSKGIRDKKGRGMCVCEFNMIGIYTVKEGTPDDNINGCTRRWPRPASMYQPRSVKDEDCEKSYKAKKLLLNLESDKKPELNGQWETCLLKDIWKEPKCDWFYGWFKPCRSQNYAASGDVGAQTIAECEVLLKRKCPDCTGMSFHWRKSIFPECIGWKPQSHQKLIPEKTLDDRAYADWMSCILDTKNPRATPPPTPAPTPAPEPCGVSFKVGSFTGTVKVADAKAHGYHFYDLLTRQGLTGPLDKLNSMVVKGCCTITLCTKLNFDGKCTEYKKGAYKTIEYFALSIRMDNVDCTQA